MGLRSEGVYPCREKRATDPVRARRRSAVGANPARSSIFRADQLAVALGHVEDLS